MEVVVERGREVLADDALPFSLTCPEVGLVGLEILH